MHKLCINDTDSERKRKNECVMIKGTFKCPFCIYKINNTNFIFRIYKKII